MSFQGSEERSDIKADDGTKTPAGCPACFMEKHSGHDLGLRHESGSLYTATCHDCGDTFARATQPMVEAIGATSQPIPTNGAKS